MMLIDRRERSSLLVSTCPNAERFNIRFNIIQTQATQTKTTNYYETTKTSKF